VNISGESFRGTTRGDRVKTITLWGAYHRISGTLGHILGGGAHPGRDRFGGQETRVER